MIQLSAQVLARTALQWTGSIQGSNKYRHTLAYLLESLNSWASEGHYDPQLIIRSSQLVSEHLANVLQTLGTQWLSATVPDFAIARLQFRFPPVTTVYQRQLSMPSLRGRLMSTSKSWGVNGHTTRCISPISMVLQLRLVSGWGLQETVISVTLWAHRLKKGPYFTFTANVSYYHHFFSSWRAIMPLTNVITMQSCMILFQSSPVTMRNSKTMAFSAVWKLACLLNKQNKNILNTMLIPHTYQ